MAKEASGSSGTKLVKLTLFVSEKDARRILGERPTQACSVTTWVGCDLAGIKEE